MSDITNNYAEGSCVFEAGSSQNGDVHITGGTFYQGGAKPLETQTNEAIADGATDGGASAQATPLEEDLFHFVHPEVDEQEEVKVHQQVKRLVGRFGIKEICEYLTDMAASKKILLPQNVKVAYDELVRMGMPDGEGFAYKTFEKYYKRK